MDEQAALNRLVRRAQTGDLDAYSQVVKATQVMVHAVARGVLRDSSLAEDAAQEAYLRAFRRLGDLGDPAAFISWLRRIVITVALNMRRGRRLTLLCLDDVPEIPVLDEAETGWSEYQRQRLAGALLTLTGEERRICDRRYHGRWSAARLAQDAGVDEAAMRKRLQRIRDKLRKEIEMAEQRGIRPEDIARTSPRRSSSCSRGRSWGTFRRTRSARSSTGFGRCTRTSPSASYRRSWTSPKRASRSAT